MKLFRDYFTVKQTTDYSIFKYLGENRDIKSSDKKFKDLKENIKNKGYLISPVVVSSEGYVVDGQHRIQACKELNLPVLYVVNSLINSVEDVVDANNMQRSWSLMDYVKHWAMRGDENSKQLMKIVSEYPEFGDATVADAFCGHKSKKARSLIKNGEYVIDTKFGNELLENARELRDVVGINFKQAKVVRALRTVMKRNPHFDLDHFKQKTRLNKWYYTYNNEADIVESLINVYNYKTRKGKIV